VEPPGGHGGKQLERIRRNELLPKVACVSLGGLGGTSTDLFLNPQLVEQCYSAFSLCCFHWDASSILASLLGQKPRVPEHLRCFKRANQGDSVE